MNKERLLQRFLQYVTCASETYQEREFCIMMEEELTSLGLHWERQEIGECSAPTGGISMRFYQVQALLCFFAPIWTLCPGLWDFSYFERWGHIQRWNHNSRQ